MKLIRIYLALLAALTAFSSVSCFWSDEKPDSAAVENRAANLPENKTVDVNSESANSGVTQKETDVIPKTEEIRSLKSPTETYKTFAVATLNKDVNTIKQTISKGSLEFVEASARRQNLTVNDMLIGGAVKESARKIPEIRNEKIEGNKATIEVKNEMGFYDKIPFVKENGEWKLALDELNKEAQKKLDEIKKRLSEPK